MKHTFNDKQVSIFLLGGWMGVFGAIIGAWSLVAIFAGLTLIFFIEKYA